LDQEILDQLPNFRRRMEWFLTYRPHLVQNMSPLTRPGVDGRILFALPDRDKLTKVLRRVVDPQEFLSPYGIRSLSKYHEKHPYTFHVDGEAYTVRYVPGESHSGLFGGNSNWRGPIWFPTNYLMLESLRKYDLYYGDDLKIEYPAGSGEKLRLNQIAEKISRRLADLFTLDEDGSRPAHGGIEMYREDPACHNLVLFNEYFHAETGAGLGASHQTGWTALVAKLIQECAGGETCVTGE
jgi:hypothetical protein